MLTKGKRPTAINVLRSAVETAHCRMRYLEFKKRNKSNDVDALQPASICYVYREKSQASLRSDKVGGFSGPYIYLGRQRDIRQNKN